MKYGFIIDNRKCIGCHACTTACKSEHDVPIGVNRTWVKQTEKGEYPNTRRVFSVLRCNHCTDAPCVTICPTQALFTREDGIIDFDNDRCIACKSCMQACPYDALYIDPETSTAAKCNYCVHRVDIGLEPACVNVCPEHAIISGDMENPDTEIAQLLSREQVTVRRPEKGTLPNVYYIDGDSASLTPSATDRSDDYIWNSQSSGVGHFSKFAEAMASGKDLLEMAKNGGAKPKQAAHESQVEALMNHSKAKRVYDTPDKGILWGWEVSAYVWTKAISAGSILIAFLTTILTDQWNMNMLLIASVISLVFLGLTGILLVKDLDQPKRFIYVLLRPQWKSWLVKGAYAITLFGAAVTALLVGSWLEILLLVKIGLWTSAVLALIVAVYTAFLFAQAKGRDFWQSPTLAIHMLAHSFMAGAGVLMIINHFMDYSWRFEASMHRKILLISIAVNLVTMIFELTITHPTEDAKRVVQMILKGRYKKLFWIMIIVGNVIPLLISASPLTFISYQIVFPIAALLTLIGVYLTEKIWVEAPQRIPLT